MQPESAENVSLHRSLESVLKGNSGRWFRFILGILKNEADAEDVIQEAVRRVLSRNRSFPNEEQVRLYLGRAIGNTAFEMYNSRKRDRMRNTTIRESALFTDGCAGADALIEEKEAVRRKNTMLELLFEGLKRLPEKQEKALRITILEAGGRSIRDTGVLYKIPYSTLRHRNKQGLRKMRRFLEHSLAEKGLIDHA